MLIGGVGLAVGNAWDLKDVVKAIFSDKPYALSRPVNNEPNTPPVRTPKPPANIQVTTLSVAQQTAGIEAIPTQAIRPVDSVHKVRWSPPPPGFMTADTFNYLIYRQTNSVTATIKTTLDTIHGNLMLDLTPFTLIVKPSKILVMLFADKNSYHNFTNLPSWSGASSDLQSDTMYVIEGGSFYPLSVHELTHLYFDGYFLPTISPLWLSEGIAVYMQIYESKKKPSWIDNSLRRIVAGDIIPLEEMTGVEDLNTYNTAQAELWYTQAYSLVDYLLNNRSRDEFYKFCTELKSKTPLHLSLYRAYGMPFNKVSVLQNVWLHDLQKTYQEGSVLSELPSPQLSKQVPAANTVAPATVQNTQPASQVSKPQATVSPAPATAPTDIKPVSKPASKPAQKSTPQKTKINKLQTVDASKYWGRVL